MTTKLLNAALPSDSPLKRYTNNLPDRLSVCFIIPIRGDKSFRGHYTNNVIYFTPFKGDVSLGSLLDSIPEIDINSIGITKVFKNIMQIRLKSFSFDVRSREMNINLFISSLHLFGNTVSARDINIEIQHTFLQKQLEYLLLVKKITH